MPSSGVPPAQGEPTPRGRRPSRAPALPRTLSLALALALALALSLSLSAPGANPLSVFLALALLASTFVATALRPAFGLAVALGLLPLCGLLAASVAPTVLSPAVGVAAGLLAGSLARPAARGGLAAGSLPILLILAMAGFLAVSTGLVLWRYATVCADPLALCAEPVSVLGFPASAARNAVLREAGEWLAFLAFLLAAARHPPRLATLARALVPGLALSALLALWQTAIDPHLLTDDFWARQGRATGSFGDPNSLVLFSLLALWPIAWTLRLSPRAMALAGVLAVPFLLSGTRTGLGALLAGGLLAGLLGLRLRLTPPPGALAAMATALGLGLVIALAAARIGPGAAGGAMPATVARTADWSGEPGEGFLSSRGRMWRQGLAVARAFAPGGAGVGAYLPELGNVMCARPPDWVWIDAAGSEYLQDLATLGPGATLLFLLLALGPGLALGRSALLLGARARPDVPLLFAAVVPLGAIAAAFAFLPLTGFAECRALLGALAGLLLARSPLARRPASGRGRLAALGLALAAVVPPLLQIDRHRVEAWEARLGWHPPRGVHPSDPDGAAGRRWTAGSARFRLPASGGAVEIDLREWSPRGIERGTVRVEVAAGGAPLSLELPPDARRRVRLPVAAADGAPVEVRLRAWPTFDPPGPDDRRLGILIEEPTASAIGDGSAACVLRIRAPFPAPRASGRQGRSTRPDGAHP